MKYLRYLLVALIIGAGLQVNARTIHWLTFVDTTDENVGEIDVYGRQILYNRIIGVVNAALKEKGYTPAIHDTYGARFSPEACKNELANLRVGPEDIVVFYYIGHGGRSVNDKTQWPQMQFGTRYDEKFVPLEWVHKTIKGKNPRLAVTIGMCCNSYVKGLSAKSTLQFSPNFGNTYMSQQQIDNLAKLFTDYKGDVLLSSSTPGQTSGCLIFNDKVIDAFTACAVESTDGVMNGSIRPEWNTYLNNIKHLVGTRSRQMRDQDQTVQFVTNVTSAPMASQSSATARQEAKREAGKPAPKAPSTPAKSTTSSTSSSSQNTSSQKSTTTTTTTQKSTPAKEEEAKSESSDERDQLINYFNRLFGALINTSLSDDDRIEMAETFLSSNSELANVPVVTLGQDGNVQVGRQSLEDFVGRLATSHLLQGISVDDIPGDKIYVKEVYKK